MIDGVAIRQVRVTPDSSGRTVEVLSSDEPIAGGIGRVWIECVYSGAIRAWRRSGESGLCIAVTEGMARIVLVDGRDTSQTRSEAMELHAGVHHAVLVRIPAGVWFGLMGEGSDAIIAFLSDSTHPDATMEHAPVDDPAIPYRWTSAGR